MKLHHRGAAAIADREVPRLAGRLGPRLGEPGAEPSTVSHRIRGGDLDRAIAHYRRALELEPDAYRAHHNLANTLRSRGELELAIHHYEEALKSIDASPAGTREERAAAREVVENALLETRGRLAAGARQPGAPPPGRAATERLEAE